MATKTVNIAELWARFGDTGRAGLMFARKHYLVDVVAGIAIGAASTIAVEAYESSSQ